MHQGEIKRETLPARARAVVDAYLALPMPTGSARPSCPYFNNRRRRSKSQLRVLKGKGTPAEIVEETMICAKLARMSAASLPADELKQFLVREDLGVDCSGFAYHVLDALARETAGKSISRLVRPIRAGLAGKLIARLRPAENTGVATFADHRNSVEIALSDARPGDFVVFLGTGKDKLYNHMIVITSVERDDDHLRLSYAHSYAWPSDGAWNHGVREGEIATQGDSLLAGAWKEKGSTGLDNYTLQSARGAKSVSLRRLLSMK